MNFPVPHYRRRKTVRDTGLEDSCYVDLNTKGRPVSLNFQVNNDCKISLGPRQDRPGGPFDPGTLLSAPPPRPVYLPTPVSCGRGATAARIFFPDEYPPRLLDLRIKFECARISSYKPGLSLSHMITKLRRNKRISADLQGLQHILYRYGQTEKYSRSDLSFSGGVLSRLNVDSEEFMIFASPELGGMLCMSPILEKESFLSDGPAAKLRLGGGGPVFQISTSRALSGAAAGRHLFATRQLETSTLWGVSRGEENQLEINPIQQLTDASSALRCIDVSPFIKGEWCELRKQAFTIARCRERIYHRSLDHVDYHHCQWGNHPQIVLLARDKALEMVDWRVDARSPASTLLSLDDDRFRIGYNLLADEVISCLAPSCMSAVYALATGKSLILGDQRMNRRLLYKAAHLMNEPPLYINCLTAPADLILSEPSDHQWMFLTSSSGASSAALVHRWTKFEMSSCPTASSLIPMPEALTEPVRIPNLADTLERLQQRGLILDWSAQNRLTQPVLGQTCQFSAGAGRRYGKIRLWTCTASGDLYLQHFDPVAPTSADREEPPECCWLTPWACAVREIEQKPHLLHSSEIYDGDRVLTKLLGRDLRGDFETTDEEDLCEERPLFEIPDAVRFSADDLAAIASDSRTASYLQRFDELIPVRNASPPSPQAGAIQSHPRMDDSLAHEFNFNLISSTPYQRHQETANSLSSARSWMSSAPRLTSKNADWDF